MRLIIMKKFVAILGALSISVFLAPYWQKLVRNITDQTAFFSNLICASNNPFPKKA